jgi:hypothetical protein
VELVLGGEGAAEPERLGRAAGFLAAAGYRLEVLRDPWLLLAEASPGRGWGSFAVDPRGASPLLLTLPDPLALPGLPTAAALVAENQGARAIALAGRSAALAGDRAAYPSAVPQPLYQAFVELASDLGVLQVQAGSAPRLTVAGRLPRGLDAVGLAPMLGADLTPEFGPAPEGNLQAAAATAGFAALRIDRSALHRLLARGTEVAVTEEAHGLGALLLERLSEPGAIAEAGSNAFFPPTLGQLRYLDEEVLAPLLREALPALPRAGVAALAPAQRAAAALGYAVSLVQTTGGTHALLAEAPGGGATPRHWGTYAFRAGGGAPYAVQVPRPIAEPNTLEFGLALFDRIEAAALLVAGANPLANADRSADPLYPHAPPGMFNLVSQALMREAGEEPLMAVQARALGVPREGTLPPEDTLLALDRMPLAGGAADPLAAGLRAALGRLGLSVRVVDGSAATAGYGIGWSAPALYLAQAGTGKGVAALWLSPLARLAYAQGTEAKLEASQFEALGIPTVEATPVAYLAEAPPAPDGAALPAGLRASLADYTLRRDILALRGTQRAFPSLRFRRLASPDGRQTFLAIEGAAGGAPLAIANLNPLDAGAMERGTDAVKRFVEARAGWLLLAAEAAP